MRFPSVCEALPKGLALSSGKVTLPTPNRADCPERHAALRGVGGVE